MVEIDPTDTLIEILKNVIERPLPIVTLDLISSTHRQKIKFLKRNIQIRLSRIMSLHIVTTTKFRALIRMVKAPLRFISLKKCN